MTVYAATGHRPDKLGGYGHDVHAKQVVIARDFLAVTRPEKVISGVALGWDTAIAEAALQVGIPLVAAVPFRKQAAMWPEASQRRYYEILRRAAEVAVVCEGDYSKDKMQRRNEWMVDRAALVVALWNGSPGGTGNCIKYAERRGVHVVNLWPLWLQN